MSITIDNEAIVEGLATGDAAALASFDRHYRSLILTIARRIVRDEWDAEEVLQDVLWTAFSKADSIRDGGSLKAWVKQVTRNSSLMLVRKRKRVPTPMAAETVQFIFDSDADRDVSVRPDDLVRQRRALRKVEQFLAEIPEENREIYVAMELQGLPKERVADELDMSVAALKSRLHRVRVSVRNIGEQLEASA